VATIPASENVFPEVLLEEVAAPAAAATGQVRLYAKSGGTLYSKDDAGAETDYTAGAAAAAAHIADTGDAHDASAISIVDAGTLYTATDVEAALAEVMAAVSGGGIPATTVDAKGDLIVGTADNTVDNLTAGANGAFLQALSSEATGLIWRAMPTMAIYTRTSATYTTNSTSFVDVDGTNLALAITTLARRVRVNLQATGLSPATANAFTRLDIDIDGARVGGTNGLVSHRNANDTTQRVWNASFTYLTDVLTAASHTFKLQWMVSAGTASLLGVSSDVTMRFWVEETFFTT
jgi:hypothetical protein